MKKKFQKLSLWSFVLAIVIFAISYVLFHYMTPEGAITMVFRKEAGKPVVTNMCAMLGVMFLFSSILNAMIAKIFFSEKA